MVGLIWRKVFWSCRGVDCQRVICDSWHRVTVLHPSEATRTQVFLISSNVTRFYSWPHAIPYTSNTHDLLNMCKKVEMTQMRCVGVVEPPLGRGTLLMSLMMSLAGQYCLMAFSGTATVFGLPENLIFSPRSCMTLLSCLAGSMFNGWVRV